MKLINTQKIGGIRLLLKFLSYKNYERIFIWSIGIFSLVVQALLNTYYLSPFTTTLLLGLSVISFFSLAFYSRYPQSSFLVVVISFGVVLTISNAIFSATNGGGPILAITEMFYAVVLIYRYGVRKTWWIPVIFIIGAYAHLFAFESKQFSHWVVDDPEAIKYTLYFLMIGTALYVFSISFSKKLNILSSRLTTTTDRLQETRIELEKSTKDLELAYESIKKISNHNSHDLRRPLARVMSLLQLYNDVDQDLEMVETMIGKSLKEEIRAAIKEMQEELQDFEELTKISLN